MALRALASWVRLPRPERWQTAVAAASLLLVRTLLRTAGFERCQRRLSRSGGLEPAAGTEVDTARAVATAVERAARGLPLATTCLDRSLTLWWLLRRRRIAADLRIGVRRSGSELEAHAWIEVAGQAVNDSQDVRERYRAFEGTVLPPHLELR